MLLDKSLFMSDAQSTTTSVASTDYIDTLAAGNAYVGDWFVVRVDDAFVAKNGAPAIVFRLETDADSAFAADGVTLCQSSSFLVANLTADTIVYKCRIPSGAKRYLRGYKQITNYSAGSIDVASGSYDMFIVKDADINNIPGAGA